MQIVLGKAGVGFQFQVQTRDVKGKGWVFTSGSGWKQLQSGCKVRLEFGVGLRTEQRRGNQRSIQSLCSASSGSASLSHGTPPKDPVYAVKQPQPLKALEFRQTQSSPQTDPPRAVCKRQPPTNRYASKNKNMNHRERCPTQQFSSANILNVPERISPHVLLQLQRQPCRYNTFHVPPLDPRPHLVFRVRPCRVSGSSCNPLHLQASPGFSSPPGTQSSQSHLGSAYRSPQHLLPWHSLW